MPYFSVHKFYYHWTLSIRFPLPIYLNCIYCLATFAVSFLTCLMIVVMARFSSLLPISTPIEYRLFEISASFPKCPLSESEIQDIDLEWTDCANELGSLLPHLNINIEHHGYYNPYCCSSWVKSSVVFHFIVSHSDVDLWKGHKQRSIIGAFSLIRALPWNPALNHIITVRRYSFYYVLLRRQTAPMLWLNITLDTI